MASFDGRKWISRRNNDILTENSGSHEETESNAEKSGKAFPPDSRENDEKRDVESGEDGAEGDGGHVADDRSAVGVSVKGRAAVFAEQIEPAAHFEIFSL